MIEHLTYIARDSAHYCLQCRKWLLENVYIDACFVLAMNYLLTYFLRIHVPFSVTASCGGHDH